MGTEPTASKPPGRAGAGRARGRGTPALLRRVQVKMMQLRRRGGGDPGPAGTPARAPGPGAGRISAWRALTWTETRESVAGRGRPGAGELRARQLKASRHPGAAGPAGPGGGQRAQAIGRQAGAEGRRPANPECGAPRPPPRLSPPPPTHRTPPPSPPLLRPHPPAPNSPPPLPSRGFWTRFPLPFGASAGQESLCPPLPLVPWTLPRPCPPRPPTRSADSVLDVPILFYLVKCSLCGSTMNIC